MNMPPIEVLCVGETLMDLLPGADAESYLPRAGGAPANVAAALASLGRRAGLASAVGADWLGDAIVETLRGRGVDTTHVIRDPRRATGVAVVNPGGESGPGFLLYRSNSADAQFELSPAGAAAARQSRIVHVSSLLTATPAGDRVYRGVLAAIDRATTVVSYDVNLRESAWDSHGEMVASALRMIEDADIVKVTAEELRVLRLDVDPARAGDKIWLITDGGDAARLVTARFEVRCEVPRVTVVDTTGAGDASLAALLDSILAVPSLNDWALTDAERTLEHVVRVGSYLVQQPGAMCDLRALSA